MRRTLTCIVFALLATQLCTGLASAKVFAPHAYNGTYPAGSFTGADVVGKEAPFGLTLRKVAVDQSTRNIYVGEEGGGFGSEPGFLYKLDSAGASQPFSALTPNTVIGGISANGTGETRVDNSGGPTQGRIYQWAEGNPVKGFLPSGEEMGPANGHPKFPLTETGDNCGGDVAPNGNLWITNYGLGGVAEYTPEGERTNEGPAEGFLHAEGVCAVAIDSEENFYTVQYGNYTVKKWNKAGEFIGDIAKGFGANSLVVDRSTDHVYIGYEASVEELDPEGVVVGFFGGPDSSHSYPGLNDARGVAVDESNHLVYVTSRFPGRIDSFSTATPITIPDTVTQNVTNISATGATLHGNIDPDSSNGGSEIVSCEFKWGPGPNNLENTASCDQAVPINGSEDVSATLSGLTTGTSYFFQITAKNSASEVVSTGRTLSFQPAGPPLVTDASVSSVHSDGATLSGTVDPHGGRTTYQIEYGLTEAYGSVVPAPEGLLPSNLGEQSFSYGVTGLKAGTMYHFRVSATNTNSTIHGPDHTFTTFPFTAVLKDPCANAHVRQQVGAALLPDCRAYELVSASDTGGYDVESDLVSGQEPFGGFPNAEDRVLYGIHSGAIPGPWNPTNRGVDPYIASRGEEGWSTTYAGIQANNPFAASPFASDLDEASPTLASIAFGGAGICSPCFADGSTGLPVREADGDLVQGMAGPKEPGPSAVPDGLVRKRFSADGTHFTFGSTSLFAEGGHNGTGDVSIYDRDLSTGQTQAVSTDPSGDPLTCLQGPGQCHSPGDTAGISELDVSSDGSRIVVGQLVDTDAAGNQYFHLYMHIGTQPGSVDLTPGTVHGALYDGMTADGTAVYFTTSDPVATVADQDTDTSADIFRASVAPGGATLTRVSVGSSGAGDTDACDPVPNTANEHWNAVAGAGDCSAVAIGGGGGVASDSGAIYFLSPEQLDGSDGLENAPNLYSWKPGSTPQFVATLESSLTKPEPPAEVHPYDHSFGSAGNPQFVAVDTSGGPSNGDIYVADNSTNVVRKYDPAGNLITSWGNGGVLDGSTTAVGPFAAISGLAVGADGRLYVGTYTELNGADGLFEFDHDGTFNSEHAVVGAIQAVGISVDDEGNVFYLGYYDTVMRFDGTTSTEISNGAVPKSGLAVNPSTGDLYVGLGGESIAKFSFDDLGRVIEAGPPCANACEPTATFGAAEVTNGTGMAIDPSNGDLYVDEGARILRFNAGGKRASGPDTGVDRLSNSKSVAVAGDGSIYATTKIPGGANVAAFSPRALASDPRIDNPAVVDSVNDSGTRHPADFQVTPSGGDAAFSAAIPLTGFDSGGHVEIFRYDSADDATECASCNPTGARPIGDSAMAVNGLSLTDDGRVFFNSDDAIAPRDLDSRQDAYEWSGKLPELISTGGSPFDSSLLTVSADGTDVFFFTRDSIVPQDHNGILAKIYDAREEGGFPFPPDPAPCKASDECHGAGSAAPGPLSIGTITGTGGNAQEGKKCRKGFKRRGDRCVKGKATKQKRHRKRRSHRR